MGEKEDIARELGLPATASHKEVMDGMAKFIADRVDVQMSERSSNPLIDALALRDQLRPTTAATTGKSFTDMVDAIVASEKLTYGDAARRVSMENPDLWDAHRQAADLNGKML